MLPERKKECEAETLGRSCQESDMNLAERLMERGPVCRTIRHRGLRPRRFVADNADTCRATRYEKHVVNFAAGSSASLFLLSDFAYFDNVIFSYSCHCEERFLRRPRSVPEG